MSDLLIPCSVQVLVRNAVSTIGPCLDSLRSFDQVIVQDGLSTDGTREILQRYHNVTLLDQNRTFMDENSRIVDFASVRNEGIRAAKYDWILVVDADEAVTPAQVEEVRRIITVGTPGAFMAFRRFVVNGVPIMWSAVYPALQIRLFHRSLTDGYVKPIHERLKLHDGVVTTTLAEELLVPLPSPSVLRPKYHRYLRMEVKRTSDISLGTWAYWVLLRNVRSIAGMLLRLAWIWFVPRKGKRLPLSYEGQFLAHSLNTIVYTFPLFRSRVLAP